ncbi:hypothetical protein P152DRAFT_510189 [Eremomyces bilateralis CBS 781.70]|uniref:Ribosome biogenesis protein Urb1 n=1 Tax=Eremomyces bilateralis CBS 781.70 TaxID=1392243 RepID=A0A6G1GFE7_9PEZI|nr:uncharacterized protein P152DRAFT_510189 [Eremomyces bilateralis CBS 781.70]KAF1816835.1 hypothetical protein P152DRAFT_510189 [Eremomyces bilateralis CBS 781.70]
MSKRPHHDDHFARKSKQRRHGEDGKSEERRPKKINPNHETLGPRNTDQDRNEAVLEDVVSTRQLHTLLAFQQHDVQPMRHGIRTFKGFLDSILYGDPDGASPKRAVLKEYLEQLRNVQPETADEVDFAKDLCKMWSFASSTDNEALYAAVTAVLALLMKTISTDVDLTQYGDLLGKSLLHATYAKLFSRGLSAPKHREYIISPCLRLLSELASFNGGALVRLVYRNRDSTLEPKIMARNLSIHRDEDEQPDENGFQKPSVRSNAVRYLLAILKFGNEGIKTDLVKQASIFGRLFEFAKFDHPGLALETLDTLKQHVLLDKHLMRKDKGRIFNGRSLTNLLPVARREVPAGDGEDVARKVVNATYAFLTFVCTNPESGVLPRLRKADPTGGTEGEQQNESGPQTRILSDVCNVLRPHSIADEAEILMQIFARVPPVLPIYFKKPEAMPFDPKLTATWIGYASFLFKAVQAPFPELTSKTSQVPLEDLVEFVLPGPLTEKALTRCFNHSSELINLFAIRILIKSMEKLQAVTAQLRQHPQFEDALETLQAEFAKRCPDMKTAVTMFRRLSDDKIMEREAASRLLTMYFSALPQVALREQFDISVALTQKLERLAKAPANNGGKEESAEDEHERQLHLLDLEHLVYVAGCSPGFQWWNRSEKLQYSPFIALLKVLVASTDRASGQILDVLTNVVSDNGILQLETKPTGLSALVTSLRAVKDVDQSLAFLDECINRFVRKQIKYGDDLEQMLAADESKSDGVVKPVSPIIAVLAEQWPFLQKKDEATVTSVSAWVSGLLVTLAGCGENLAVLNIVRQKLYDTCSSKKSAKLLRVDLKEAKLPLSEQPVVKEKAPAKTDEVTEVSPTGELTVPDFLAAAGLKEHGTDDYPGLTRWMQKDVESAIMDGDVAELILCLCAEPPEIRKQAMLNGWKFAEKVKASSYAAAQQTYMMFGELLSTAEDIIEQERLPFTAAAFAIKALPILAEPSGALYPKINIFLMRRPKWTIDRIPTHFAGKILLNSSQEGDKFRMETLWLLDYFIEALRSPKDMEIFRTRQLFERILILYSSPYSTLQIRQRVLALLYRATFVDGSTALITRHGVIAWIKMQMKSWSKHQNDLKVILGRLLEMCDKEKVKEWSNGTAEGIVDDTLKA